ncbi:purine nucleosidase [Lentzea sp. NBRC 105346]|uniref:nucleoside hydrolase n=1 Tax=Lentzea sp. NBRC 105346 TaxID=3032205 RepID=UPI0024A0679C|nr:nucleoside hydrolase [Lentzea sp. NBRC 105346]GLZ35393.1 purine nucleosidase [Lentzea sp. NBRC 105346]
MAIPLLIDTDPGVDDAFALALAARSPEVDLIGVTTVFGNVDVEQTTRNAQRLLAHLGRTDVPVAKGAAGPARDAREVHGEDGLSGLAHTLPEHDELDERDAVTFLKTKLKEYPDATVAAIGPLTNIARLLDTGTHIKRLIVMGGGIGQGNVTETAEFNFWSDPQSASRVLRTNPLVVPINLTRQCLADGPWLDTLDPVLNSFTPQYRRHLHGRTGQDGILIHDAVAVAEAIWPGTLTTRTHLLDVEDTGALVDGKHQVEVAESTDWEALKALLGKRLSG